MKSGRTDSEEAVSVLDELAVASAGKTVVIIKVNRPNSRYIFEGEFDNKWDILYAG